MDNSIDISLCNSDTKFLMFIVGSILGFGIIMYIQKNLYIYN